ncbi:MAG: hypothetical protein AAB966_00670, partial [Patescibacteria group bacterium]
MAEKTKTSKIPSVTIDKEFLKNLGLIIEKEVKERKSVSDENIAKEIKKEIDQVNQDSNNKNDLKIELSDSTIRHITAMNTPHINVDYTIKTKEEIITFKSLDEVLETPF